MTLFNSNLYQLHTKFYLYFDTSTRNSSKLIELELKYSKHIEIGGIDYGASNGAISSKIGVRPAEIGPNRASFRKLARFGRISVGRRPILFKLAPLESASFISPILILFRMLKDFLTTFTFNHFHFHTTTCKFDLF